ncbi:DEAD/DEAH box helicase [Geoglobus acetivorans]|uniref:DEAD/DEAH box helicase n=1 Tax=Geoglobus acetivorans TaxID=565033 RepID=A0ABZ3H2I1_GEOAI|nr:DEAD/DEAH box helicase [Geoglobus acetivorans]
MEANEYFCPKCGRLKSRCVCTKKSVRQRNLEIFEKFCQDGELKPLFTTDCEVVLFRRFSGNYRPDAELDRLDISENLKKALELRGIEKLFRFQYEAIERILAGRDVIITAPTGTGKTEAFLIPLIERIASDGGKAMVIYPTKALIRDQLEKARYYAGSMSLTVADFHGDSDRVSRRLVLAGDADIILTNPDMIDYHLRNTPAFRRFVERVKIMVFDELHSYSGYFGSNIYWLVKRIERFCNPQIIASSATIDNPGEFGKILFERDFEVISENVRTGELNFIMFYGNFYRTVVEILRRLKDRKVLIFGNSYRSVETLAWILEREGLRAYVHKSGLPADLKRRIESDFRTGRIRVLVSTSTLELGIDIGDVDVVISEPVPFSNFLQRIGRAGRRRKGTGILILREEDTISNYYRKNPEEYFREKALCYAERDNELVKEHHILSMAMEMPLTRDEIDDPVVDRMVENGLLIDGGGFLFSGDVKRDFSLRGAGKSVKIYHGERFIGERVLPIAVRELHPGGVFIHNRKKYRVLELNLANLEAYVEEFDDVLITTPMYSATPRLIRTLESTSEPIDAHYCDLEVTIFVTGYILKNPYDDSKKTVRYLEKPVSYSFRTKGFLFAAPFPEKMDYEDYYAGSFHALEHVLIDASDAITGGGSSNLGGVSTPDGFIFVYDASEGGNGVSKLLFSRLGRAMEISLSVLENCECGRVDGCPKCTYSYQCGNNNQPLNRFGAIDAIRKVLSGVKRKPDISVFEEVRDFVYYP